MNQQLDLQIVEDISQQKNESAQRKFAISTSSSEFGDQETEFVGHKMGLWPLDKTYWINFHQQNYKVTQIEEIARFITNLN